MSTARGCCWLGSGERGLVYTRNTIQTARLFEAVHCPLLLNQLQLLGMFILDTQPFCTASFDFVLFPQTSSNLYRWPMSRASNTTSQWTKSSSSGDSVSRSHLQSGAYLSTTHLEHSLIPEHASTSMPSKKSSSGTDALGLRNPFPFRTRLNFSWAKAFSLSAFKPKQAPETSQLPLHSRPSQQALMPSSTLPPLGNMGSDLALTSLTDSSTHHNKSAK